MTRSVAVLVAAGVVALAAGVVSGAGAEWDVYRGESIQDAVDDAGGDAIYVRAGTNVENVDVWKRVTLDGKGADAVTSCDRGKVIEN